MKIRSWENKKLCLEIHCDLEYMIYSNELNNVISFSITESNKFGFSAILIYN